ncbi:glutamate receptor ionotropic kainate 2-like [Sarcoptes scabiei]|nr:glutamate receptor ionotropic kainate 2-like [Sarcoptes scabiei]
MFRISSNSSDMARNRSPRFCFLKSKDLEKNSTRTTKFWTSNRSYHKPMRLNRRKSSASEFEILFSIFSIISSLKLIDAEICRRVSTTNKLEVFDCPRIFESNFKAWCCGSNSAEPICCNWAERAKELGYEQTIFTLNGLSKILISLLILFTILSLLYYFCGKVIRYYNSKRQNQFSNHRSNILLDSSRFIEFERDQITIPNAPEHQEELPPPYHEAISQLSPCPHLTNLPVLTESVPNIGSDQSLMRLLEDRPSSKRQENSEQSKIN